MRLTRRALLLSAAAATPGAGAAPAVLACPLAEEPAVLVPGVSGAWGTRLLGRKLYRGLMRLGAGGTVEPDLASAAGVSADGLTMLFRLRTDVTWHDSGAFTAEDVVFSLARFHAALQPALRLDRLRVEAPDARTVVVHLTAPSNLALRQLDALSLPIVPRHVHDRPGWALDARRVTPVGTGPFRLAGWLRLVRFDWYAGPRPFLDAIECPVIPAMAGRLALAAGEAPVLLAGDAVELPAVPQVRALPGLALEAEYLPGERVLAGLRLNPAVIPLDQAEVRTALGFAVDRAAVLREGWAGLGRVTPGEDGAGPTPYDPRAAASHLNAAGLRPDESGVRARLHYLHPPGPPWAPLYPVLAAALRQVGIELLEDAVGADECARRVAAGQYDLVGTLSDQAAGIAAVWLVEPGCPVVRDRRLRLPGGVLGSFADAVLA